MHSLSWKPRSERLQLGRLQSRATDFDSPDALIGLEAYSLRKYNLGGDSLALQISDLQMNSLDWEPTI